MANYNVKLTVDTTQHDKAMEKAGGQVNMYSKRILDAKDKIIGLAKKFPALALAAGAATAAFKGFDKAMRTTDSGGDTLDRTLTACTASVDQFFRSLKSGSFTSFITGLQGIITSAKDAFDALDNLQTQQILNALPHAVALAEAEELKVTIMDKGSTRTQFDAAKAALEANMNKQDELYKDDINTLRTANEKAFHDITHNALIDRQVDGKPIYDAFVDAIKKDSSQWGKFIDDQIAAIQFEKDIAERNPDRSFIIGTRRKFNSMLDALKDLKDIPNDADNDDRIDTMEEFVNIEKQIYDLTREQASYQKTYMRYLNRGYKGEGEGGGGGGKTNMGTVNIEEAVIEEAKGITGPLTVSEFAHQDFDFNDAVNNANAKIASGVVDREAAVENFESIQSYVADLQRTIDGAFDEITSGVLNVSGAFVGLGKTLGDAFNSEGIMKFFESLQSGLDVLNSFYQTYQAIASIIEVVNTLKETSVALDQAQTAASAASTAASLTQTSADSGAAIAGATKSGAGIPFPYNLIAIAAGIAAVIGALSLIGKFADGGIVGGNTSIGDMNIARVNKGEMILNQREQSRLFNILSGVDSIGTGSTTSGNVTFRISGGDLIGVLNNQQKKKSRVL